MLCTRCAQREARIHLTSLMDTGATTERLCVPCHALESGRSVEAIEEEFLAHNRHVRDLERRTERFEVRPRAVQLRVGQTLDLLDFEVVARARWLRRERVSFEPDLARLDPEVVDRDASGDLVARRAGRTALAVRPVQTDRRGERPSLMVEIEVRE